MFVASEKSLESECGARDSARKKHKKDLPAFSLAFSLIRQCFDRALQIADSHLPCRGRCARPFHRKGALLLAGGRNHRRAMITRREDRITRAADCPSAKITIARGITVTRCARIRLRVRSRLSRRDIICSDAARRDVGVLSFPCRDTCVCRASAPLYYATK